MKDVSGIRGCQPCPCRHRTCRNATPVGLDTRTKTKKPRLACLLQESQEARANSHNYQEIPPGKRSRASYNQFNSPKLIGSPITQEEPTERKKSKRKRKPKIVRLSDYLGTGDPPFMPPSCCALSQGFFFPRPLSEKSLVLLSSPSCKKREKNDDFLTEPLPSPLSAKTKQQPPL